MKKQIAVLLCVAFVFVSAVDAGGNRSIRIGRSIGGISLGMTKRALYAQFGTPTRVEGSDLDQILMYRLPAGEVTAYVHEQGVVDAVATDSPGFVASDRAVRVHSWASGKRWHGFTRSGCAIGDYYWRTDQGNGTVLFLSSRLAASGRKARITGVHIFAGGVPALCEG